MTLARWFVSPKVGADATSRAGPVGCGIADTGGGASFARLHVPACLRVGERRPQGLVDASLAEVGWRNRVRTFCADIRDDGTHLMRRSIMMLLMRTARMRMSWPLKVL